MDKRLMPLACLVLVTGCPPVPPAAEEPGNDIGPPVEGSCPAEDYQAMVGEPLAAVTYPKEIRARIVRPGDVMTMEYVAERMNIRVDDEGVVTRVYCG